MKKNRVPLNLQFFAEENLTVLGDFAKAQSIDFTEQFTGSLTKLLEALGVTRKMPLTEGTLIKTYKSVKDIKTDKVSEGELIPLSKITTELDKTYEIEFDKYRKAVSMETIQKHGFTQAVSDTDDKMLKEIQKALRTRFFEFLSTGTGKATGIGFQAALAQAWGAVQTLFEDDGVTTIAFINPLDVADYIGGANVTTQTIFGMTFITGFTGVTAITNTNVPKGKIYATAPDNIVLAYVPATGSELAKAFTFTTDQTGYIGITHDKKNDHLVYESIVISAVMLFAERLDGVVVIDIADGKQADAEKKYVQSELEKMTVDQLAALATLKGYTLAGTDKAEKIQSFLSQQNV